MYCNRGVSEFSLSAVSDADLNVGCYSVGMHQQMFRKSKNIDILKGILAKGFENGCLHLLGLCEVGGHKLGIKASGIQPRSLVSDMLHGEEYRALDVQDYVSVWRQSDVCQPGGLALRLFDWPTTVPIYGYPSVEPILVIWDFRVAIPGVDGRLGRLVHGQLHIRAPSRETLSEKTKMKITRAALAELERKADDGAIPPVVVLTGDIKLHKSQASSVIESDDSECGLHGHWSVVSSSTAYPGDVAFVHGSRVFVFDVPVGASYSDKGLRAHFHDFFGMTIKVRLWDETTSGKSHKRKSDVEPDQREHEIDRHVLNSRPRPCISGASKRKRDESEKYLVTSRTKEKRGVADTSPGTPADILADMRDWYESRVEGDDVSTAWRHLQQCLFRNVRKPVEADLWRNGYIEAPQPGSELEGQVMLVSQEHVARQVREVITTRERWLEQEGLPRNTVMNHAQRGAFLAACKQEYHTRTEQKALQKCDAATCSTKQHMRQKMRSRFSRHQQRLAGSLEMWRVLSFVGRFDPSFFDSLREPVRSEHQQTE